MRRFRILTLPTVLALTLGLTGVAHADPVGPQGINTWSVTPDPASTTADLTLSMNFDFDDSNSDQKTKFCIEGPSNAGDSDANWWGTMPMTITLHLVKGFTEEYVDFTKDTLGTSQSTCPGGTRVALYENGTAWSNFAAGTMGINASGTGTVDLDAGSNTASAGTGDWTLTLEEASSTPGSLQYNHELVSITTVYASDSPTCGGYGTPGSSCFQSLSAAYNAVSGSNNVVVVGDLSMPTGGYQIAKANDLDGTSNGRLIASGGCTTHVLDVNAAADVSNLTIDGSACSAASVAGLYLQNAGTTVDNVTVESFDDANQYGVWLAANATLQNSTVQDNEVGVRSFGSTIQDNTITSNDSHGIQVAGGTPTVQRNTISSNGGDGISSSQTGGTFQDNDLLSNTGDGIQVPTGFNGTIQENHVNGNGGYGINFAGNAGAVTLTTNNVYGNSGGQLVNGNSQPVGGNYLGDTASTASLGGFDGAIVGSPFLRSNPGIDTSNVQSQSIGASASYDFGTVVITNNHGSNAYTFVLIDLASDTPFAVGLDPYQNTQCSNYFDVYIDNGGASGFNVGAKIDVDGGACQTTYAPEACSNGGSAVRYVNSDNSTWQNTANEVCTYSGSDVTHVAGTIDAGLLGGTGFVAVGDYTPTVVTLTNITAQSPRQWLPVALAVVTLVGVGSALALFRRRYS